MKNIYSVDTIYLEARVNSDQKYYSEKDIEDLYDSYMPSVDNSETFDSLEDAMKCFNEFYVNSDIQKGNGNVFLLEACACYLSHYVCDIDEDGDEFELPGSFEVLKAKYASCENTYAPDEILTADEEY